MPHQVTPKPKQKKNDVREQGERLSSTAERPSASDLMRMTPEQRGPYLRAAADSALPLYEADLARPEADRVLTYDLENGEFLNYATGQMDG